MEKRKRGSHNKPIRDIQEFRTDIANNRESLDDVTNFCFTAYCKPLIPCVRGLHEVMLPGGSPWSKEDR